MSETHLLFDNTNGTQKFWSGRCDAATGRVVIEHGKVGARPRTIEIPKERFSEPTPELEILERASKKRREGYYDDISRQGSSTPPKPEPEPPSRSVDVMAALKTGNSAGGWFF